MIKISSQQIWRSIKEYVIISFGLVLYAFAYTTVIIPSDIVSGGMGGIGLLVYYATGGVNGGIPLAYSFFVGNAILLIIGFFIIGGKFGTKTLFGIFFISFLMGVFQEFIPRDLMGLMDDKLLSGILGGALAGIGVSMVLSQGGSLGGTDIIAMIINKYRSISYGKVIMSCDFIILGCSYLLFKDIAPIIYGYISVAAFGYTVDFIMAGNRQTSQIMIISRKYNQIAGRISTEMNRGVTLLNGQGWYSKEEVIVVMVLCRKNETQQLFRVVREVDPQAFITMASVTGVYGQGFDKLKTK